MELSEVMLKRRSTRHYKEGMSIEPELIDEMLKAAQLAPSWKNFQTGRYYVVQKPELMESIRAEGLPAFNAKNTAPACAYIVTTYVKDISGFNSGEPENEVGNGWGAYDLGCQNAYMLLKAAELGIDSLIMGIRNADAIKELLNIPGNEQVMAVIALGYASKEPPFLPRKELSEISVKF